MVRKGERRYGKKEEERRLKKGVNIVNWLNNVNEEKEEKEEEKRKKRKEG